MSEPTTETLLEELGRRLRRERLNVDMTRARLAELGGVSVKTIQKMEAGENASMASWIAVLRGLGLLDRLDALLPDRGPSPMQLVRRGGRERKRASGRRSKRPPEGGGSW